MKVQNQIDELLALRASEWLEILKSPTDAERAAFVSWLSESRRHVQEFLEVAAVDDAVGEMPAELRENLHELVGKVAPSRSVRLPQRARPLVSAARQKSPMTRNWRLPGLAAGCTAIAVTAVLSFRAFDPSERYSTDIGEQRTIQLADTSVITLNADSQIQWQLDDAGRDIKLRRGEAIFKVAPDGKRPFRVHTRAGVIQAIGTQFNVYARVNGDTRVSVLEGRVRLTANEATDSSEPQVVILKSGEEADIRLNGTIRRNAEAIVESTVAWRERRLAFTDVPLEDMIVEFNRYNRSPRFRLENVPRGTYRFAGIFDATDPQSLAKILTREPDLAVDYRGEEIVIRSR
jgi:transmembrane sensor